MNRLLRHDFAKIKKDDTMSFSMKNSSIDARRESIRLKIVFFFFIFVNQSFIHHPSLFSPGKIFFQLKKKLIVPKETNEEIENFFFGSGVGRPVILTEAITCLAAGHLTSELLLNVLLIEFFFCFFFSC